MVGFERLLEVLVFDGLVSGHAIAAADDDEDFGCVAFGEGLWLDGFTIRDELERDFRCGDDVEEFFDAFRAREASQLNQFLRHGMNEVRWLKMRG